MSTKAKVFCSSLVLSLIVMLPATTRAEAAVLGYEGAHQLFEQIQDLELMQRNIEACYHAETGAPIVKSVSRLSLTNPEGLDGALMNRVFGHLAGTTEYERFITEYRALIQRPDYKRLHTDELFAEYKRCLESGRIRLLAQLKELQESLAEKCSSQAHEGLTQAIPVRSITIGHAEGLQRTENGRVVPAIQLQVGMPLSGSRPLAEDQISVSRILVHGMDRSGSPSAAAPTIGAVELHILVTLERGVPREEVSSGHHQGLVKEVRSGILTEPQLSGAIKKGVGAWDQ